MLHAQIPETSTVSVNFYVMEPSGTRVPEDVKEWVLDPGTEYRFELDPDTSLAIKVGGNPWSTSPTIKVYN